MKWNIDERYGSVVIEFRGQMIGGPKADIFRHDLHDLILENKTNIVADLSNVKFMNSNGLGILIGGLTTMRNAGGDLKLSGATDQIKSLLMVSQLVKIFDNYETVEDAIKAYG